MKYEATVLADSISPAGVRVTTIQGTYPRFIHAEVLRHRVQSHSVMSSRAVPTEVYLEMVRKDPFIPETFNERVKGMGVGEVMGDAAARAARHEWTGAARDAAGRAQTLMEIGLDKSRANRLLEPFLPVVDIITATEWSNFLALRQPLTGEVPQQDFPAQPEFQIFARMVRDAMEASEPVKLGYGDWHMPKITEEEAFQVDDDRVMDRGDRTMDLVQASAGRCAKVSFATHDKREDIDTSMGRQGRLVEDAHWSPSEHVCRPMDPDDFAIETSLLMDKIMVPVSAIEDPDSRSIEKAWCGNFRGWVQLRALYPYEHDRGAWLAEQASA